MSPGQIDGSMLKPLTRRRSTPNLRITSAAISHFQLMSSQAILFTGVYPMTGVVDIGSMIERSPSIRGGRPCIAGTGVSVRRIAQWHNFGLTPEEIAAKFGHLSLAQVHAALAYYHANRAEIDDDLAAEDAAAIELERQYGGSPGPPS